MLAIKSFIEKLKTNEFFRSQLKTFWILFFASSSLHSIRSGWSFASKNIQLDTGISDKDIGVINMIFLLFLGIGFEINGHLGDKRNPKHVLMGGILFASCSIIMLSFSRVIVGGYLLIMILFQALNGYFESACLPQYYRILGNWYSAKTRGLVISLWIGNRNLGDIFGIGLGVIMISGIGCRWDVAMFVFATISLCTLLPVFKFILIAPVDKSNDEGIRDKNEEENLEESNHQKKERTMKKYSDPTQKDQNGFGDQSIPNLKDDSQKQSITIRQALNLPGVPFYIAAYMNLKSLNYGLIFWLPKYFQDQGLASLSAPVSILWSIGIFLGGFGAGYLSDRLGKRAVLMPPCLIILILCFIGLNKLQMVDSNSFLFIILSFLMGIFQGAPQTILAGPLIVDLGRHPKLKGKAQAVGTVTGLIEGTGSVTAAFVQLIIPTIGEKNIFILFSLMAFAAFISLTPVALGEYYKLVEEQKKRKIAESQQAGSNQNEIIDQVIIEKEEDLGGIGGAGEVEEVKKQENTQKQESHHHNYQHYQYQNNNHHQHVQSEKGQFELQLNDMGKDDKEIQIQKKSNEDVIEIPENEIDYK